MSRMLLVAGVMMIAGGCSGRSGALPSVLPPVGSPDLISCPDPRTGCTHSNGTGVYFAEGGGASIGDGSFMITHFISRNSTVRFQGRYQDSSGAWRYLSEPGVVYGAFYRSQAGLQVVRLDETGTVPSWTLFGLDPRHPSTSPSQFVVAGADMKDMKLYVGFQLLGGGPQQYVIDFPETLGPDGPKIDGERGAAGPRPTFYMRWAGANSIGASILASYCTDSNGAPDRVIFQGGIDIDPLNGHVTRSRNNPDTTGDVTMSCLLGAPATVYGWGYQYSESSDLFYFAAAIHMKRASYCGNEDFYTRSPTHILFSDDRGIGKDPITRAQGIEAWWTPDGASCVNIPHARHREMIEASAKSNVSENMFVCNGATLALCPPSLPQPFPTHFLADAPP